LEYIFILRFGHYIFIIDWRKILWIGKTSYGLCTPCNKDDVRLKFSQKQHMIFHVAHFFLDFGIFETNTYIYNYIFIYTYISFVNLNLLYWWNCIFDRVCIGHLAWISTSCCYTMTKYTRLALVRGIGLWASINYALLTPVSNEQCDISQQTLSYMQHNHTHNSWLYCGAS
jgi:hypothetical protein